METVRHQVVRYEFNFVEVIFRLMGRASKSDTAYLKGFFDAFGVLGGTQIVLQIVQKDFVIFVINEDDSFFNPLIINMATNSLPIYPMESLGRHILY